MCDADAVVGCWNRVEVECVGDVSEKHVTSIVRVEVSQASKCWGLCSQSVPETHEKGRGAGSPDSWER